MSGERILVVDDGVDMREFVIQYVIEPNGYQAVEAKDGLEALDHIRDEPPDLIILDLQMPRLDGLGLLRKMQEGDIHIPVVLMTFFGSEEIAIEVFRLGVRDYVIKPFTDDELLNAIERALVETRLRRERDSLQRRLVTLNHDLQQRVHDYQAVLEIGTQLAAAANDIHTDILATAHDVAEARYAAILKIDTVSGALVTRQQVGETEQNIPYETVQQALETQQIVINEANPDEYNLITLPILLNDRAVATLCVEAPVEKTVDHVLRLLGGLADYAAVLEQR